MILEMLL